VRKEVANNLTETKVRVMEGPDRLHELAEMIGGQRITDTTRAQAQELLDAARAEFHPAPVEPRPPRQKLGKNGRGVKAQARS
jgi:hypothetical protein